MLKTATRWLLAALLLAAGVMHFVEPWFFVQIMPRYLPWHWELVYLSGAIEIVLGVLLLVPATRRLAAWGAIALFVAVFPANLHMALAKVQFDPPPALGQPSQTAAWLRLPMQLVLIWWAWQYARSTGLRLGWRYAVSNRLDFNADVVGQMRAGGCPVLC